MMFPQLVLQGLILTALIWTGGGALALILLLIKDWKNGELW